MGAPFAFFVLSFTRSRKYRNLIPRQYKSRNLKVAPPKDQIPSPNNLRPIPGS